MSVWKQVALALVVMVGAALAWAWFYPGAGQMLARWGIDWVPASPVATASNAPQGGPAGPGGNGAGRGMPRGSVVTMPVMEQTINDRLSAIGTGRASSTVTVKPFSSGRLTEILVQSGSTVAKGDVIARLDAETEQISSDRAAIALKDAQARLDRVNALRSSNTASAVQVTEAELAVENARLAQRDAELALARRSVEAPISGVVGILPITAGNYVGTDTALATIDDRSDILVDFWVPERFAGIVSVGSPLTATSVARPGEVFSGSVSAVDNRIDAASRTLQVQARLANEGDRLRAGMSFQVAMRFPGDAYPAVDPLAVQWGADGAFVWAIRNGRAERVPVRIIQRNTETVLVDAPIGVEDTVVTEGIHIVRDGAEVTIASRQGPGVMPPVPDTGAPRASGS